MIRELLLVGVGGGVGSAARYLISHLLAANCHIGGNIPLGTLTVNVLGSFVIGILLKVVDSSQLALLLVVGFCGGFTTFSSFSADSLRLIRGGDVWMAALNIVLNVAMCIAATALGNNIMEHIKH